MDSIALSPSPGHGQGATPRCTLAVPPSLGDAGSRSITTDVDTHAGATHPGATSAMTVPASPASLIEGRRAVQDDGSRFELDEGWRTGRWTVPILDYLGRPAAITVTVRGVRIAVQVPAPYPAWLTPQTGDRLASALLKAGSVATLWGRL